MKRRAFLALTGGGVTAGLAGCLGGGGAAAAGDNTVGMSIDSFRPDELTVEVGTTVTFENTSSHGHTVTAFEGGIPEEAEYWATGGYDSEENARDGWKNQNGLLYQGDSWEYTFETVGEHQYFCIPHIDAGMTGFIYVEE